MNARLPLEDEQLCSPAIPPAPAPVPSCGRTIDHLPHDTDAGDCPGYLDPEHLTAEEIHERVDKLRREATAYGYRAGFADRDEGREYSNAWEDPS